VLVYDQGPVNFLTSVHGRVDFIQKQRNVYDRELKKYTIQEFLRYVIQDDYNQNMDGVDLQDQFRWYYRLDGKHMWRNQKWTWALYLFVINTRCVQVYIIHKMLVRVDQEKWDRSFDAKVASMLKPPTRGRAAREWVTLSEDQVENIKKEAHGLVV
jgi:hypothetical protein